MKNFKKWISLGLSAVMALSLAACGGGGQGTGNDQGGAAAAQETDVNSVYTAETLMLDNGEDLSDLTLNTVRYVDDYVYASGYSYDENGGGSHVLLKFSPSGDDVEVGYLMGGAAEDVLATTIGSDGNFYMVRVVYGDDALMTGSEASGTGSTFTEGPAPEAEPSEAGAEEATDADVEGPEADEDVIEDADDEFVNLDDTTADGPVDMSDESIEEAVEEDPGDAAGGPAEGPEGAADEADGPAEGPDGAADESAGPGSFDDDRIDEYASQGEASPADEEAEEEAADGVTSPMDEFKDDPEIDAEQELTAEVVETGDGSMDMEGEASYVISCVKQDGTELWRAACASGQNTEEGLYYVNAIEYTDSGLLVTDSFGLQLYSKDDGSLIRTVGQGEDFLSGTPYALPDGTVALMVSGTTGNEIDTLNIETGELGGHYPVPSELGMSSVIAGQKYPLYIVGSNAVYGFTMDESAPVKVIDYIDSDMDIMGINSMAEMGDGSFVAVVVDSEGTSEIQILTQVDPEVVANRKTLTLGCYYLDYEVRKQVFAFNKQNQEARISIIDYSQFDSEEGTEGLTKLNTDIASGSAPDIMLLSNSMPVGSYISKGVFEDLTPYFDQDEEIAGSSYLNNVLDAFKTDGKMYTIVPSFYAITIVGKQADIGDGSGFTLDMADGLVQKGGVDPARMFGITTRDSMLYQAMELCGDQFIDWDKTACSFDSEEFVRLLKFIAQFPEKIDENSTEDTSADYRTGKSLFYPDTMGGFDEYTYLKYGVFGTDITMAGYPAQTPGGAVISPQIEIAVNSSSEQKDACWSFVRRFLLDEYQSTIEMYWPVSVDALDRLADKAMEPVYYTDESGNQVEDFIVVNIGGEEIKLPRITQEEAETIKTFLGSLDRTAYFDNNVENIIAEEAQAFFAGQKSAEDVADVIQSRVKIYINENS